MWGPLFCTSGDVCYGFQIYFRFLTYLHAIDSPDSPLVHHMLTSKVVEPFWIHKNWGDSNLGLSVCHSVHSIRLSHGHSTCILPLLSLGEFSFNNALYILTANFGWPTYPVKSVLAPWKPHYSQLDGKFLQFCLSVNSVPPLCQI